MLRVLYVDDDKGLLEIGKIFLEEMGLFSIDTIDSATAALALIRERAGTIRAFVCDAPFQDIGTPADYLATSLALARSEEKDHRFLGSNLFRRRLDTLAQLLAVILLVPQDKPH